MKVEHHPLGRMCGNCIHRTRNCSHLPFSTYKVVAEYKDMDSGVLYKRVICQEYRGCTNE